MQPTANKRIQPANSFGKGIYTLFCVYCFVLYARIYCINHASTLTRPHLQEHLALFHPASFGSSPQEALFKPVFVHSRGSERSHVSAKHTTQWDIAIK